MISGNQNRADATAKTRSSRWAFLRRPVNFSTILWSLLFTPIAVVGGASLLVPENRSVEGVFTALLIFIGLFIITISVSRLSEANLASADRSKTTSNPDLRRTTEVVPPKPPARFSQRLASYLHVPESDVLAPRARWISSMPFWCAVIPPQRSTFAKSVEYIRAVLRRIRDSVRGN